jgi:ankyrin repeat protein
MKLEGIRLRDAIAQGDIDELRLWLGAQHPKWKLDPNDVFHCGLELGTEQSGGDTDECLAANRRDCLWLALEFGANPNLFRDHRDRKLIEATSEVGQLSGAGYLVAYDSPDSLDALMPKLLDNRANLNRVSSLGKSALHVATSPEMVEYVLGLQGMDARAVDDEGNTALCGPSVRHAEAVRLLIEAGANPRGRNSIGNTALHQTVAQLVRRLQSLDFWACVDKYGAVYLLNVELKERVVMLLESGVDPNARNDRGRTVLDSVIDAGPMLASDLSATLRSFGARRSLRHRLARALR